MRLGRDFDARRPRYLHLRNQRRRSRQQLMEKQWDYYLGDVASAFLHSSILRILGVQSRELEAVADV